MKRKRKSKGLNLRIRRNIMQSMTTATLGLLHYTKKHAPKETGRLIGDMHLINPYIDGDKIIGGITIKVPYAEIQDEKVMTHRENYADETLLQMAGIGQTRRKKNRKYSQSHAAQYSRGLRFLKQGLAGIKKVKEATHFIDKGLEEFNKDSLPQMVDNLRNNILK